MLGRQLELTVRLRALPYPKAGRLYNSGQGGCHETLTEEL